MAPSNRLRAPATGRSLAHNRDGIELPAEVKPVEALVVEARPQDGLELHPGQPVQVHLK